MPSANSASHLIKGASHDYSATKVCGEIMTGREKRVTGQSHACGGAPAGILRDSAGLARRNGANAADGPKGPVGVGTVSHPIDGDGVNEHDGHERMVVRGRRDDGEHVWLMCWECREILSKVRMCGQLTRKGKTCRAAVLDAGKSACRVHLGLQVDGE